MMIPGDVLAGDCGCLTMDWGVNAVAEVVTVAGDPPEESVTETTVMVVVGATRRIPIADADSDVIEMTLTVPKATVPEVPDGATLRWRYDGHLWNVRDCRNPPGDAVSVFDVRRAD
ncbi:MAG TPA: hypothetical protein VFG20_22610 [Planctomycetaceae bacterium]|nr:hypothetical protein [Planctomycetaceae bacterium]